MKDETLHPGAETIVGSYQPMTSGVRLIRKVLVANRGEIACRVMRTCRAMGIATVAVFSDADVNARHVREADEAVWVGPAMASASYLNIGALVEVAQRVGADAVHPGYGFLSENADFAAACQAADLVFIGPSPEVIARMGSKREAKVLMAGAGVPVAPGYEGEDQTDAAFVAAGRHIGYPVLVKASAGGGGKGMRVARREEDLADALAAARREALVAFGDETLLLEKLLSEPRHVEFQIFGDSHGNVIHLGERECSIQRRYQKIIEETPSPALTPELRERMGNAAVIAGRQLGYTNAGTVEFMLDPEGHFYFLEVNTRLQVEHPVTEMVTGLDLVRWQILVAEGYPLPLAQDDVRFTGHAIEARVYAEDPANSFLPMTGTIVLWRAPEMDGVRVDAGIASGDTVAHYYDPMLAKISAYGDDRAQALRRLEGALAKTTLFGVRNNLDFLRQVVSHPAHVGGALSTAFIERYADDLLTPPGGGTDTDVGIAALVAALQRHFAAASSLGWRNNRNRALIESYELETCTEPSHNVVIDVHLTLLSRNSFGALLVSTGKSRNVQGTVAEQSGVNLAVEVNGHLVRGTGVEAADGIVWVKVGLKTYCLRRRNPLPQRLISASLTQGGYAIDRREPNEAHPDGAVIAPMPGTVIAVIVTEGQLVHSGDPLIILGAMKMEHTLHAPRDGVVAMIRYGIGEQVRGSAVVMEVHTLVS